MKRILVCVDASPRAALVLHRAAEIAQAMGASLILLRVVGLPHGHELPKAAMVMSPDEALELWRRDTERDLAALRTTIPDAHVDSVSATVGSPWSTIVETAKEFAVDLIVIGAHGYGPVDRLLGTTSAKVVNHAEVSVLVVR